MVHDTLRPLETTTLLVQFVNTQYRHSAFAMPAKAGVLGVKIAHKHVLEHDFGPMSFSSPHKTLSPVLA